VPSVKAKAKIPLNYSPSLPPARYAEVRARLRLKSQRSSVPFAKAQVSILVMAGLLAQSVTVKEWLQLRAQLKYALSVKAVGKK
jgi:hypothetical protein